MTHVTQLPTDGSTPVRPEMAAAIAAQETCRPKDAEEGRTYKHHWIWNRQDGSKVWTNSLICTVCGETKEQGV